LERGSVSITIPADGETLAFALLSLDNGETITLQATALITPNTKVEDILFTSNSASYNYSVEANGTLPAITNVQLNGLEGAIRLGKHTNRVPFTPITSTYTCIECGTHPVLNNTVEQSFNILSFTDALGNGSFETQVTLNSTIFMGCGHTILLY